MKEYLAVGVSVAALIVSLFAAEQARRAAEANERIVLISEEQARPRLDFRKPSVTLNQGHLTISVLVENVGTLPGVIRRARVDTLRLADGSSLLFNLKFNGSIIYPGRSSAGKVTANLRRFAPAGAGELDFGKAKAKEFGFNIEYELYGGKHTAKFSDSIVFPWLEVQKLAPPRPLRPSPPRPTLIPRARQVPSPP